MKPFRSFVPPLAAMLMTATGGAPAQGALIDRSEMRFISRQMGVHVEGRVRKWRANMDLRPQQIAQSKAEFEIDLASLDLAGEDARRALRGAPWFASEEFPVARFTSTTTKDVGGDRFEVAGTLSIMGIERDVLMPVALKRDAGGNSVAVGRLTFNRLDFGIGGDTWADTDAVANEVSVRFRMVLPPLA